MGKRQAYWVKASLDIRSWDLLCTFEVAMRHSRASAIAIARQPGWLAVWLVQARFSGLAGNRATTRAGMTTGILGAC